MKRGVKIIQVIVMAGIFFAQAALQAQSNSYSSALEKAMQQRMDKSMGTVSSSDKKKKRQAPLENAYTYVSKVPTQKEKKFNAAYVAFRKQNKIPNYIGDAAVDQALKNADDSQKEEAVKIVETEKLLHQIYETYHTEKSVDKALGVKGDSEMEGRTKLVAKKSASILRDSITKLSRSKAIVIDRKAPVFLASGGRYFSGSNEGQAMQGIKNIVVSKIRKDVMAAMSNAINVYLRTAQKKTATAKVQNEKQLMAYVKGDQKKASTQRATAIRKLMKAIKSGAQGGAGVNSQVRAYIESVFATMDEKTAQAMRSKMSEIDKKTFDFARKNDQANSLDLAAQGREFSNKIRAAMSPTERGFQRTTEAIARKNDRLDALDMRAQQGLVSAERLNNMSPAERTLHDATRELAERNDAK